MDGLLEGSIDGSLEGSAIGTPDSCELGPLEGLLDGTGEGETEGAVLVQVRITFSAELKALIVAQRTEASLGATKAQASSEAVS
jgi:hypothetical protein